MMINKNRFRISNDKKVLHKIGKRWVTVSALTLALLGGAAAASTVTTHADATTTPAVEAQHTDNVKKQINSNLNSAANSNNANSTTASAQSSSAIKPSAVQSSAANMHNALLQNAANQKPSAKGAGSSLASNAPIHQSTQPTQPSASSSASVKPIDQHKPFNSAYQSYMAKMGGTDAAVASANNGNNGSKNNQAVNNKPKHKLGDVFGFQTGQYYGLNYEYDPTTQSLEFLNGTLTWNGGGFISNGNGLFNTAPNNITANDLKTIVFDSDVDTSHVTNMSGMFDSDDSLQTLDLGNNFNTSHVTDMSNMFNGDGSLQTLNLGNNFNTSNVTNMSHMFGSSISLHSLTLPSSFDTTKAITNPNQKSDGTAGMFESDDSMASVKFNGSPKSLTITSPNTRFPSNTKLTPMYQKNGNTVSSTTTNLADGQPHVGTWLGQTTDTVNYMDGAQNLGSAVFTGPIGTTFDADTKAPTNYSADDSIFTYTGGNLWSNGVLVSSDNTYTIYVNDYQHLINSLSAKLTSDSNDIAKINSLTNDNTKLSQEVSYANSVAQSDVNAVNSWKASSQAIATNLANAGGSNNTNSSAISSLETASTSASNALGRANASLVSDATSISNLKNELASVSNSAASASASANTNAGWIHNNSNSVSNASAQANDADTWVKNNSASLNNASTIANNAKTSADEAMSSLNADSAELGWLAGSETQLSLGSSQASSNARWITNNSATINALSGKWTSVDNQISTDSQALDNAIKTKADNNTLNTDYNTLSGDITNASSVASRAGDVANQNKNAIANLKSRVAITFTFTQNGNKSRLPVTLTNGYIKANGKQVSGNTYDITSLLNAEVAGQSKHVVGTYTITLGDDNDGNAKLQFNPPHNVSAPAPRRLGMMLGAAAPSADDNAHDVYTQNNQAEYKGDIILNFGSHQAKVPFDTGATNSNVLASDKVNLLNYAKGATKPSDYINDNLISGFDTTGFKFTGASTDSEPSNFTIKPSDATNQNGADVHSGYDIILNYSAQPVTETINYVYGTHNEGSTTTKASDDTQSNWTKTDGAKSGWQLANPTNNPFTYTNHGSVNVNVTPIQQTDNIAYIDQAGDNVGNQTFTGNDSRATDAGNNSFDVTKSRPNLDTNYTINSGKDNTVFAYDGKAHEIHVTGKARTPKNPVNPSSDSGKPAAATTDANNDKSSQDMPKPASDSQELVTVTVNDYSTDGKFIGKHTKYVTVSGKVGDHFTIKPSDFQTYGYNANTQNGNIISGKIGDKTPQPNTISFSYNAKPYNPNAKASDITSPQPITVQYFGEKDNKANQLIQTYTNAITGSTGTTGDLSNIEAKANVPQGYTVKGSNYNYTITTQPQTIKVSLNSKTPKQIDGNYTPKTPTNQATKNVPSDATIKNGTKHGFVTVIINEEVNGKVAHTLAQSVDESNLGVGDDYTIAPTSFTPTGYQVDNDTTQTGTVNPDGSLSVGHVVFNYDVNSSEIAPITVTYYNQYGDLIDKNTGKSVRTGEQVTQGQATLTISSSELATLGAIGDHVDITGFLNAPLGHHFTSKDIIDAKNQHLNNIQLQKATPKKTTVRLGLTLFMAMPKPNSSANKPASSASAKPSSASVAPSSKASSASSSANVAPSSASSVAPSSANQSVAPSASSAAPSSVAPQSTSSSAPARQVIDHGYVAPTNNETPSDTEAQPSDIASTKPVKSVHHNHTTNNAPVVHHTTTPSVQPINQPGRVIEPKNTGKAKASVESKAVREANAHAANVQREAASHMVGVGNKLAQPEVHAADVRTPRISATNAKQSTTAQHKLPQTNEAKAAGLMGASAIMAALGLAGADVDRKRRRE